MHLRPRPRDQHAVAQARARLEARRVSERDVEHEGLDPPLRVQAGEHQPGDDRDGEPADTGSAAIRYPNIPNNSTTATSFSRGAGDLQRQRHPVRLAGRDEPP
jgi:hypothetical protein